MGCVTCVTSCFGNSKDGKKKKKKVLSREQRCGIQRCSPLQPVEQSLIAENLEKNEDELSMSDKKRVTFDRNVKTHEPISILESTNSLDLIEIAIKIDEPNRNLLNPTTSQPLLPKDEFCPPNHRYMNCTEGSDNEEEEVDAIGSDQETDFNDGSDDDRQSTLEHVWSEAIPVASMEARTDEVKGVPVHNVLNPLENIFEWKAAKSQVTITPLKLLKKENHHHYHGGESMEEIDSVDASLSNWLVTTTPRSYKEEEEGIEKKEEGSSKSPIRRRRRRLEDRPILGALTMKEYSWDDMPIIGTWTETESSIGNCSIDKKKKKSSSSTGSVSSFKGIPNTTSKYREDKKVNWHSTPFEKRLDRALHTD